MTLLTASVLIVDDEPGILRGISTMLMSAGILDVVTAGDSREVIPLLERRHIEIITLDLQMPHVEGTELLKEIRAKHPETAVIILTANNQIEKAVECMRLGAYDYHVKPVNTEHLIQSITRAHEAAKLRNEIGVLRSQFLESHSEAHPAFSRFVTVNERMRNIIRYAAVVAPMKEPVLICGESGAGKDRMAEVIHEASGRIGPLVKVNVAGLGDEPFRKLLFGTEGNDPAGSRGHIENAEGGSLYLDDFAELGEQGQLCLTQFLESGTYVPVGASNVRHGDVRILLSATPDVDKKVRQGQLRKDLFYRLQSHRIDLPALRERIEDVPYLFEALLGRVARRLGKPVPSFSADVITLLLEYPFPGNTRELELIAEQALSRMTDTRLTPEVFRHVPGISDLQKRRSELARGTDTIAGRRSYDSIMKLFGHFPTLEEAEDYLITEALKLTDGNQKSAASLLDITRQTISRRLKQIKKNSPENHV